MYAVTLQQKGRQEHFAVKKDCNQEGTACDTASGKHPAVKEHTARAAALGEHPARVQLSLRGTA